MNKLFKFFLVVLIMIFGLATFSYAQVREADIALQIEPKNPEPFQEVKMSLSTFIGDIDKANIAWSLDGILALEGTGEKEFVFRTKEVGNTSTVDIDIVFVTGGKITKKIIIQPGSIDLLWQAVDSYTPRFYKGKALPSIGGFIKVVALPVIIKPSGEILNEKDFSYKWKKNEKPLSGAGGWAKNFATYTNSYLDKTDTIEVSASSQDNLYGASKKITISPISPGILFYQDHPILGTMYNKALEDNRIKDSLIITAEPYFFSRKDIGLSDINFNWSLFGEKTDASGPENKLALRKQEGQSGRADVKLEVTNPLKQYQKASQKIFIDY